MNIKTPNIMLILIPFHFSLRRLNMFQFTAELISRTIKSEKNYSFNQYIKQEFKATKFVRIIKEQS